MPPVTPAPTPVLDHLLQWSDRHPSEFSIHAPPCDVIGNSAADRVLAAVFRSAALEPDDSRRSVYVSKIALIHARRLRGTLNAKPERREELRAYWDMILVLASWNRAILDARASA